MSIDPLIADAVRAKFLSLGIACTTTVVSVAALSFAGISFRHGVIQRVE
jgi:hypothetical protein